MNRSMQPVLFLALACFLVLGGVYGLYTVFSGLEGDIEVAAVKKKGDTQPVVIASRDLYQGVQITEKDLFVLEMPRKYLPRIKDPESGELVYIDFFSSMDRVISQVPRERILINEIVRPERLADGAAGVGFNAMITRGMRAISVNLRGARALSGLLDPGNYVDLIVTMDGEGGATRTDTIMQSVVVIGVDSMAEDEDLDAVDDRGKQKPSVTFLVTPEQAEEIAFADEMGQISLALRNVTDATTAVLSGADLDKLLGRMKPLEVTRIEEKPVRRAAPKPTTAGPQITIIRGSVTATETMKTTDGKTQQISGGVSSSSNRR